MEGTMLCRSVLILLCVGLCIAKSIHLETEDKEDLKHVLRRLEGVLDSLDGILSEDAVVQVNSLENDVQEVNKKTQEEEDEELDSDVPRAEPAPAEKVERNEDGSRPEFTSNDDMLRDQHDLGLLVDKLRSKLYGGKHNISPEINEELKRRNKDEDLLEALKLLIEMKKDLKKDHS